MYRKTSEKRCWGGCKKFAETTGGDCIAKQIMWALRKPSLSAHILLLLKHISILKRWDGSVMDRLRTKTSNLV